MELDEAIGGRRSIRRYKEGAVIPRADVDAMIQAATWAPSGTNMQPWRFIVVTERELIAHLARTVLDKWKELSKRAYQAEDRRVAAFCRYVASYGGFFGQASAVILACTEPYDTTRFGCDERTLVARLMELAGVDLEGMMLRAVDKSVAMAVQNLILKAHELGYGTCVMDAPLVIEGELRQSVGIPEGQRLVMVIPVGVPAHRPRPPKRMPIDEVVRYV